MKQNIFEEIERFKLLSGYDTKKTLNENILDTELTEAPPRGRTNKFQRATIQSTDVLGTSAGKKVIDKLFPDDLSKSKFFAERKMGNKKFPDYTSYFDYISTKSLKDMQDDFTQSLKKSDFDKTGALKDGSVPRDIQNAIATRKLLDLKIAKKGADLTTAEMEAVVAQSKKQTQTLANEFLTKELKTSKKSPTKKKTENPTDDLDKVEGGNQTNINIDIRTIINRMYKLIKDPELVKKIRQGTWTWKEILPYILTGLAGGALGSLLTWLFMRKGKEYFPDCISGKVMAYPSGIEQAARAGKELPMNVYLNDPGNPQVMGALFTSQGKGATSGSIALPNGTSGTWTMEGDNVKIDAGGNVIYLDCSTKVVVNTQPSPEPSPEPAPAPAPAPGGCTPTADFPFAYYQMNSMVGSVQNCVGARADNCMGPQTARAIQQFLGLSETPTSLTKDIYDKVMAKCKGSTSTKEKPMSEPTQTSGDTDDFES